MKKKILSMLLAVCMIVGLLPMITLQAFAAGEARIQINQALNIDFTTTAKYLVTDDSGEVSAAAADAETTGVWNIKYQLVDDAYVMTLKGAKIGSYDANANTFSRDAVALTGNAQYAPKPLKIIVQEASSISANKNVLVSNGSITELTIESVNNAKLTCLFAGAGVANAAIAMSGYPVTFNNANIDISCTNKTSQYASGLVTASTLTITSSTVTLAGYNNAVNKATIQADTVNVNNSTLTVSNLLDAIKAGTLNITGGSTVTASGANCHTTANASVIKITTALNVTGSTLTATAATGYYSANGNCNIIYTETGAITVDNGNLTAVRDTATRPTNYANAINIAGAGKFEVKGDNSVVTLSTNAAQNVYALKLASGATSTISGGTVVMNSGTGRAGNGAVLIPDGATFTIAGGTTTLTSSQYAADGVVTMTGGTLITTSVHDLATGSKPLNTAPNMTGFTGEYYVMTDVAANGNDAAVSTLADATVAGKRYMKITAKDTNSWTTNPGMEGWTYGETAKNPTGEAKYGEVVFTYSDAENGTYTATKPTNAGTYWMLATVDGSATTYTSLASKVSFTIAKIAAPSAPTGLTATYGQTLADIDLPEGWTWADDTQSVGNAGNNTFKANYAKANYESATNVDVVIAVAKADQAKPTVTGVNETAENAKDGKITGVTAAMEYKLEGAANYTAITGTELTGLAPGKYLVRLAATANLNASEDVVVIIVEAGHEHSYGDWTDTEDGENHKKECACGQDTLTEAHKWGTGVETKPAKVGEKGEKTYTCTECGAKRTEDIPALTAPAGTPDPSNPQTGDNGVMLAVLTLVAMISLAGAVIIGKKTIVR